MIHVTQACAGCGATISQGRGRPRVWCATCLAERRRCKLRRFGPPVPCGWCGHGFQPAKRSSRYCSNSCRAIAIAWEGQASILPWASCLHCRSWFLARNGRTRCACIAPRFGVRRCRSCGELAAFYRSYCTACGDERRRAGDREAKRRREARKRTATVEVFRSREIFERDGWRCHLCGGSTIRTAKVPHPKAPTLDHVIPLAKGGAHSRANVRCAHFECNWRKADSFVERGEQLLLVG